ncbi:MAG: hypothetical protein AAF985_11365 [Bacteroidota bacterium]
MPKNSYFALPDRNILGTIETESIVPTNISYPYQQKINAMNRTLLLFLLWMLLPGLAFSQRKRKKKKRATSTNLAITYNVYPRIEPYATFNAFNIQDDDLILNYLTSNSGTFVITEEETILVERRLTTEIPSQIMGFGFSLQLVKGAMYHEIALTKLSFNKSKHRVAFQFENLGNGTVTNILQGYEQNTFAFGLRYEFGGFFGKGKKPALRFGLSGGVEPSFYAYSREPLSPQSEFPIKARIYNLEVAVIPQLQIRMSKKISLDFKVIPNVLLAYHYRVKEENPSLIIDDQTLKPNFDSPEINLAFSALLRYQIKAPKKRRRRS